MANPQDASDKEKQNGGESFTTVRRKRSFPYTQALTIILLIVQSLFTIRLWSMNKSCFTSTSRNGDLIWKIWHRNTSYMSLDHAYDGLWNETGQSALVYDDEKNVVQITMFHQLHCLAAIRKALQNAREGKEIGIDERDNTHWPHCLQFLREAVLCTADGTLERHPAEQSHWLIISGYQDMRSCGSAVKLYEYRDARKIYDYDGNLISATPWDG